ncbi:MAG: DEAD/DEAH box helicase [Betaproteobacteria bacterium]|nr:DEAD/DEAH box helicase [Betaproteobacteria bacterium]
MSFAALNLLPELLRAVEEQGYTEPTPIQAKAIPEILARHDIMGCAQTGTGKTAGFTLPLLQLLHPHASTSTSPARHPVRALVLVPTRELAAQVEESVRTYGKYVPLRIAVVYGGIDIKPQIKALHAGVEIVVATPGRLIDHLEQKSINLSQVQILVLDEADRMLDMGFMPAIKRILGVLPAQRQNLLFSATFSEEIKRLAGEFMRSPQMIEVARRNAPADLVSHQVYEVPAAKKVALLAHLIRSRDMKQVLIFVRMKRDADKLARQLQRDGLPAAAIHGDRSQGERTVALDEFKQGQSRILVATDVAARGIDIDQLPFVINYEIPNTPEDYVHRIGRTGRAGTPGEAISLVSPDEMEYLAGIEKLLKRAIPRAAIPDGLSEERGASPRHGRDAPSRTPSRAPESREAPPRSRPPEDRDAHRRRPRGSLDTPPVPGVRPDPSFDFSKPYEPSAGNKAEETAAPAPARTGLPGTKRPRPVAAIFRVKPKENA